jgi:hypothetical protein
MQEVTGSSPVSPTTTLSTLNLTDDCLALPATCAFSWLTPGTPRWNDHPSCPDQTAQVAQGPWRELPWATPRYYGGVAAVLIL